MSRRPLDEDRAEEIRRDQQVEAEFRSHVAHRVDDLVASGVPEEEARRQAWAEFGDPARLKSESREAADDARPPRRRRPAWMGWLDRRRQDVAFAVRHLARRPGYAAAALLTLALGVGGAATIVSVVDAVVLAPLPFSDPDEVVFVEARTHLGEPFSVAEPQYLDWRDEARSFDGLAAWWGRTGTLGTSAGPRSVRVMGVTHDLLPVLGLSPALGRGIRPEEDREDGPRTVALLSHDAWVRDWGSDPDVLGRRLELNGATLEVVGVAPAALEVVAPDADVLVPMNPSRAMEMRGEHHVTLVGRLAPGATAAQADADLDALQAELGRVHQVDVGWGANVHEARAYLLGESTIRAGWVLLGAAGLLLLMACVNVANFLLVRATARGGEMGLRQALGAGSSRLAAQLLTESSVLAVAGGLLGLGLTVLALPAVRALSGGRIPRIESASVDGATLLACLGAVALATLASGAAPVLRLRGQDPAGALRRGGRGGSGDGRGLRSLLVAAQVGLTVVLLVGSGLLFRSFAALTAVDPGFEPEGTLAVQLSMPDGAFTWEERREVLPRIREAVLSAPGVTAAGATAVDPFSGTSLANFVAREDALPDGQDGFTPIVWRVVTPGFFQAMGMELRGGRVFRDGDGWDGGRTPVVVDETLADRLWPEGDAVGRTLVWNDPQGSRLTVVGVVENLRDVALDEDPLPMVYRTHEQIPWAAMTVVARVDGDPLLAAEGIRARLREALPALPVPEMRSLEANLARAVAEPRFNLALLGVFAALGLVMAVVGVYGLTAFDVRRRFREIGIRVSLGARPEAIRRMIVRQRLALAGMGAAAGLALAWPATRWLEALLFEVPRTDPVTWAGVLVVVGVSASAAAWFPTGAATRVDASEVLSRE